MIYFIFYLLAFESTSFPPLKSNTDLHEGVIENITPPIMYSSFRFKNYGDIASPWFNPILVQSVTDRPVHPSLRPI